MCSNGFSWSCSGSCTRQELEEGKLWGTPVLADAGLCSPQSGVKLLGVKLLHLRGFPIFATSWGQTDRQTDPVSPCECQKLRTQPGRFEVSWVAWKV